MNTYFQPRDALLIVDLQNDFMPNGALAVPEGDHIIPIVNRWIAAAQIADIPIILSRDWHPPNHCSFQIQGGPWPEHCVQHTPGAAFHPDILLPKDVVIVNKAFDPEKEAYSAFEGVTDLEQFPLLKKLSALSIQRIWMMGLALDYCVYYSALDAIKYHFQCVIVLPGCRAICAANTANILKKLKNAGGILLE